MKRIRLFIMTFVIAASVIAGNLYCVMAETAEEDEEAFAVNGEDTEDLFEEIEEVEPAEESGQDTETEEEIFEDDGGEEAFVVNPSEADTNEPDNDAEEFLIADQPDPDGADTVSGTIKKIEETPEKGKFRISIKPSAASGVKSLKFKVWTKSDKSDVRLYKGNVHSDGTFTATVKNSYHNYKSGTFHINAAVLLKNGKTVNTAKQDIVFKPKNQLYVVKNQYGRRTINLLNADPNRQIYFKVWSEVNGKDDIKSYKAVRSGNTWSTEIRLYNHVNAGTIQVRAYSGSGYLTKTSFTCKKGENKKNGWIYENGLTFYYIKGQKQKDNRSRVSGPYQVCVNREKNTVTVYSKNKKGEYCVPVVAFVCSAGEDIRTPIGTFTLTSKKRWRYFSAWDEYVQYAVCYETGRYFHSMCYLEKTPYALNKENMDALGQKASHGCIRMLVSDAKWIYDNMEQIEEVRIYDSSVSGPLGKPAVPKIGQSSKGYYDPTDPAVE